MVLLHKKFEKFLGKTAFMLEYIIAIFVIIGIFIGFTQFTDFIPGLYHASLDQSYQVFQNFLAYALLLIVGVELILMIMNHSAYSMLELILFVIARKMLIYAHTMMDLVLGTVAILIVFIIMRFLASEGNYNLLD
ncbi:hypothetical protein CYJ57_06915 [Falseniella ignava]|uniref:Protein PsiE n=2 Tax=Falseniella ignava TaxID=137730 RepID=K1MC85_9LACT|nr:hypothetical protein HMPREF9707_01402 [Falseniella ignava CCUG 37419]PKY87648.1 hypothetical protein CYJ57_06915 [Falseniella ignava]